MDAMTILETRGLTKNFGGLRALDNVDFELPAGRIHALIGPNGAGKSTFVSAVCGRVAVDSGTVFYRNMDITRLAAHRRICLGIAYTFQITSIFTGLTVRENVALGARRTLPGKATEVSKRVGAVLERLGLHADADRIAGDLSYGHQRLLEIAMGLSQKPKLLILDEPTQGLSESEVDNFQQLLRSLAGDTTILLIEHNVKLIMQVADFVTVMNNGAILSEGSPSEIRQDEAVQSAYLGHA